MAARICCIVLWEAGRKGFTQGGHIIISFVFCIGGVGWRVCFVWVRGVGNLSLAYFGTGTGRRHHEHRNQSLMARGNFLVIFTFSKSRALLFSFVFSAQLLRWDTLAIPLAADILDSLREVGWVGFFGFWERIVYLGWWFIVYKRSFEEELISIIEHVLSSSL